MTTANLRFWGEEKEVSLMSLQPSFGGAVERKQETSSLADVVGTILDKGVVIDVFARVSVIGACGYRARWATRRRSRR
jgi:hypothetical protein